MTPQKAFSTEQVKVHDMYAVYKVIQVILIIAFASLVVIQSHVIYVYNYRLSNLFIASIYFIQSLPDADLHIIISQFLYTYYYLYLFSL